jgi:hypothetical protein
LRIADCGLVSPSTPNPRSKTVTPAAASL